MDNAKNLRPHQIDAIAAGYPFECSCGEQFKTAASAWGCRKCRKYLSLDDFTAREVVDLGTGRVAP